MALARCQDRRQRHILPSRHAFFPVLDRTPTASASRARHALAAARQEARLLRRQGRARARRPADPIAHSSVALSIKFRKGRRKTLTERRRPDTRPCSAGARQQIEPASIESAAGGCVRAALAEPRPGHPPSPQGRGFPFRSAAVARPTCAGAGTSHFSDTFFHSSVNDIPYRVTTPTSAPQIIRLWLRAHVHRPRAGEEISLTLQ